MAEIITGDTTKGIKGVGELALRISRFDSYRLFTLYENVKERKVMDISGDQKHYLVFRSPKKEIRIPEYDTNGFFEVDKVNGCVLFKITKKNAEDILGMKTAGEKIFHIVRVFEERDEFGKILNITDEVEVYNGKWGDDSDFSVYSTENKVDLLTKALAAQVDKNAKLMGEYDDLNQKYNKEVEKSTDLEKELEALRAERDSLENQLNEYMGNTYDGTILSTDTKYIAFENTLDNISFTEEQYNTAMNDLMTKGEFNLSSLDLDDPTVTLNVSVPNNLKNVVITAYKNGHAIGSASSDHSLNTTVDIDDRDKFSFECVGKIATSSKSLNLIYNENGERYKDVVKMYDDYNKTDDGIIWIDPSDEKTTIEADISFIGKGTDSENKEGVVSIDVIGNIGTLKCFIK